jgi:5'-nucleotidase
MMECFQFMGGFYYSSQRIKALLPLALTLPMLFQGLAQAEEIPITLLHLNDVYRIQANPETHMGGLARVATLVKKIEAENENTYFFFGGDTLSPSLESQFYRGEQMIAAWNQLGVKTAVLGNHEFDFGPQVMLHRIGQSQFQWLGANVLDAKTGQRLFGIRDAVAFHIPTKAMKAKQASIQMIVTGVMTTETEISSRPGDSVRFADPIQTMAQTMKRVQKYKPQITVFLTHLPMKQDQQLARLYQPALILGGHDHTVMQSIVGKTPIYKVGADAPYLGKFTLVWDTTKRSVTRIDSELIPVTSDIPEDPEFVSALSHYETDLKAKLDQKLVEMPYELDARSEVIRTQRNRLGLLIANAYQQWGKTDIAFANSGSIRGDKVFPAGQWTVRDVYTVLPFGNQLVRLEISGKTFKEVLSHSISQYPHTGTGRYLQLTGLTWGFAQDNQGKTTLNEVRLNQKTVEDSDKITITTSSYLADGGDGYSMLKQAKRLPLDKDMVETTEAECLKLYLESQFHPSQD